MTKEALRIRRAQERIRAGKIYGVVYDTLDEDDGYLTPNLATRDKLLRYIRKAAPDVIITHRSCDYHPDHRATGQLVNLGRPVLYRQERSGPQAPVAA